MNNINTLEAIIDPIFKLGYEHSDKDYAELLQALNLYIEEKVKEARIKENKRILSEVDFDAISKDFKDYNRLARKEAMGYCLICGHSPTRMKEEFQNRIKELENTSPGVAGLDK